MRKISSVALLLIVLFGLFYAQEAQACSCVEPRAPRVALAQANAVFSGKVLQIHDVSKYQLNRSSLDPVEVIFEVKRNWKGADDSQIAVRTAMSSASCGYEFVQGQEYIVYASSNEKHELTTSLCSRTKDIALAAEDLQALGQGSPALKQADLLSGDEVDWKSFLAVAFVCLLVFGGIVWLLRKKYRSR